MKTGLRITICLTIALLMACTRAEYIQFERETGTFNACRMHCIQRNHICQNVCRNNVPQCCSYANQSASFGYGKYRNEQYIRGGFLVRQLKSYRDPLQCRKTTCNCRADYQICVQACKGVIVKQFGSARVH